ncbi:MAG: ADP-ribosylglycohydrolase family protein [Candidatus Helarchaeota archaeon]
MELTETEYEDRVLGGWFGRCIGSQLGAPLEFRPYVFIRKKYAGLNDYVKKITGEEINDDEMYEIVALLTLETYGIDFTSEQLAKEWVERLYKLNFTAERVALRNLRRRKLKPPNSGIFKNPYYDFIGAQMRADIWGLICPGCPEQAIEYAKKDGCISHAREGIYGEMFIAAIIALSFIERDIQKIIEKVLKTFIPQESSYYKVVQNCMEWAEKYSNWQEAREQLMRLWKDLRNELKNQATSLKRKILLKGPKIHEIHVLPNAGIITLGLLYGQGDFERSICITALMGLDTDCNVGNVGTILGVQYGAARIPAKWKDPLQNIFRTAVKGFQEIRISKIAERIANIGKKVIENKCPRVQLRA